MSGFSAEGYWIKGQLFINRAMEPDDVRSEDERRLWASLALEQMAKWALARTSPTLVADPARIDGDQLFRALGLREGGPYVSVTAWTAFKRCAAIYRPFSEKEASAFAHARNEYLHGTDIALLDLPLEAWWPRFWSLVSVLLTAHQLVLEDLVDVSRLAEIELHLSHNAKRVEHQCEAAIEAARRNLDRYREGHMLTYEARRWERGGLGLTLGEEFQSEATCPACGEYGTVEGETPDREDVVWPTNMDDIPVVEVTFVPDYFSCPTCHLVLDNYELIVQAQLDDPVTIPTDRDYAETEYGND